LSRSPLPFLRRALVLALVALGALTLSSCGRNMYQQPKAKAFESSQFFADGSAMRPLPAGTVSRERGALDPAFVTGQDASGLLQDSPIPVTLDVLTRGQQRFDIYCSPCHNYNGNGEGEIVQRGFPQPPSFTHTQRLLDQPVGYFFNVMTNGFGRMFSYASRIPPEDRWAIADYIKALQLSQNASESDVPPDVLESLKASNGGAQ